MHQYLIDECLSSRAIKKGLITAGYSIIDARAVGLGGQNDAAVMTYARQHNLVVLTRDNDYLAQSLPHPGIIFVEDSVVVRDRRYKYVILLRLEWALRHLQDRDLRNQTWQIRSGLLLVNQDGEIIQMQ